MSDIRYINLQVTPKKWENQYYGDFEAPIALYPAPSRPSPSPSPSPSVTPSISATPSRTPSVTPSITPTRTITPTVTPSTSAPAVSPSVTPTITPTSSITPTITPTASVSPTVTPTITPSVTVSPSITPSITPTLTPTPSTSPIVPNPYWLLNESEAELLTESGLNIDVRPKNSVGTFLGTFSSADTRTTYSFNVGDSGNQGLIIVGVYANTVGVSLTGVTLNSSGMTYIDSSGLVHLYQMRIPTQQSLTIDVNFDGSAYNCAVHVWRLNYNNFDTPYDYIGITDNFGALDMTLSADDESFAVVIAGGNNSSRGDFIFTGITGYGSTLVEDFQNITGIAYERILSATTLNIQVSQECIAPPCSETYTKSAVGAVWR